MFLGRSVFEDFVKFVCSSHEACDGYLAVALGYVYECETALPLIGREMKKKEIASYLKDCRVSTSKATTFGGVFLSIFVCQSSQSLFLNVYFGMISFLLLRDRHSFWAVVLICGRFECYGGAS